jgi:hypothetical protein
MFRVKTTRRNVKRAISPLRPATDLPSTLTEVPTNTIEETKVEPMLENQFTNFFAAESAAVSLSKPWLRLERGMRIQKFRIFAESFPEAVTPLEKENLCKMLVKANDAKLLNTKTHLVYEAGKIVSIKGLKKVDGVFKIEAPRMTKRHSDDT